MTTTPYHWPQIVVAIMILMNAATWIYCVVVGAQSHAQAARGTFGILILTGALVAALSAGGFW